jgi:hypothetical protein
LREKNRVPGTGRHTSFMIVPPDRSSRTQA